MSINLSKNLKKYGQMKNVGMKKLSQFQSWDTRAESASQRLICSTCNLLQVDGSETAGIPQQFNAYLQDKGVTQYFVPFRGNRFNILFQNARATHGHLKNINEFLDMHDLDDNLLISVKADIESTIALACVRALDLIDDHDITRPLWKILDNPEISVTDMSLYYKKLHDIIGNLVQDASPIMNENIQIFYIYPPEKQLFGFSELHVINNDNEELDVLTTQAFELVLSVIKRQLMDHLGEANHSKPFNDLITCTKSVPKANQSNESIFGQLDRIKRFKPNASTAHIEGLILFVNSKTSDWLDNINNESDVLKNVSKLLPKFIEKWRQRSKDIKKKRVEI
jgi:E1A/CREB-binding protein